MEEAVRIPKQRNRRQSMSNVTAMNWTPAQAAEKLFPVIEWIVREKVLPTASARDPANTGGWFTFWRDGAPLVGFAVGSVPADQLLRYVNFANEKAARLSKRPGDISSWQSRNVDAQQYGGAVCRDLSIIFSFSGFSEHEDELICALAGNELGLIGNIWLGEIRKASGNELFSAFPNS